MVLLLRNKLFITMLGDVVTMRSSKRNLTSPSGDGTPIVMGLNLARVQVHCSRLSWPPGSLEIFCLPRRSGAPTCAGWASLGLAEQGEKPNGPSRREVLASFLPWRHG